MLFGAAPSQASAPPGGFVIFSRRLISLWLRNLGFVIYLLFVICYLEFSNIYTLGYILNMSENTISLVTILLLYYHLAPPRKEDKEFFHLFIDHPNTTITALRSYRLRYGCPVDTKTGIGIVKSHPSGSQDVAWIKGGNRLSPVNPGWIY